MVYASITESSGSWLLTVRISETVVQQLLPTLEAAKERARELGAEDVRYES